MTVIPIVIGALGTVTKRLELGLEDLEISEQVETIQITELLKLARTSRRVLEIWSDCCYSDSSEKPLVNAGVKKPKEYKK